MNLILFRRDECGKPLPDTDARARHLTEVLRRQPGDGFDCGLVNGPRGRGVVLARDAAGLHLGFAWQAEPPPLLPLALLVGLPRPQTVRKVLSEAATLGVGRVLFFRSERSEPSYADSTLWTSGEVERLLVAAAGQAFCTRLPRVEQVDSLGAALEALEAAAAATRVALDNYEAPLTLGETPMPGAPAILAVGSERGWSAAERTCLRGSGFALAHLGPRVLRVETACTTGIAIVKTRLALWGGEAG